MPHPILYSASWETRTMHPERPSVSVIVVVYNMGREAPRTLFSLSAAYQRRIAAEQYEVIVVDNGSAPPLDHRFLETMEGNYRVIRIDDADPSPVAAINRGHAEARGDLVGVLIDGARIASPGLLGLAAMAGRLADRTVILTLGFHLGSCVQMQSVLHGHDQEAEDRLLAQSGWTEDGYRLFDISVFAGSSAQGWFRPINESNAIFLPKALWAQLGGYDERFRSPGGGLANLDLLSRAVQLADTTVITLLGEGTFHQVHGGVATNATGRPYQLFAAEYERIRGYPFQTPGYRSLYFGEIAVNALMSISRSAQSALEH
jgi:glycosyltransferase involved in cell wall biosynthesis